MKKTTRALVWSMAFCFLLSFSLVGLAKEESTTKVVVDCIGREVEIPAHVERIGTLFAVSGHVVTMLDQGEKIVAVTNGLKRDILLTQLCPKILEAVEPKTHGSVNIEELVKSDPDVVFISTEIASNSRETDKFDKFGIPYLVVDFQTIPEQQYMVQMIGEVVGAKVEATAFIDYYQRVLKEVEAGVKQIPFEERVRIFHSIKEAARTDAAGTLSADWLERAGVINVSVNQDLRLVEQTKYFANMEQILLWNPDAFIINEDGVDYYIRNNPQWASLKAVQDDEIYLLPNGVSRWGHPNSLETPLALLWTVSTFYPEYFPEIDMRSETRDFYQQFFEIELSDEMIEQILSGKGMRRDKS